jgi:hypothetical protein
MPGGCSELSKKKDFAWVIESSSYLNVHFKTELSQCQNDENFLKNFKEKSSVVIMHLNICEVQKIMKN